MQRSMPDFTGNMAPKKHLKIAVLSGKGGTGKTLLSVNLAAAASDSIYVDCDVEEPNGHLFFKPKWDIEKDVFVKIPEVDHLLCNGCRKCVDFCKFNALAYINERLKIFNDVCHSCGGCFLVCPLNALSEKDKHIGKVSSGNSEGVRVLSGIMDTGEASGIPIIKELFSQCDSFNDNRPIFIDCPPGSSCIVMESIKDADYCILVAEPTIFGRHNFDMVYNLVKLFNKPNAAVINKSVGEYDPSEAFCNENGIKILEKIPYDTELGMLSSNAEIAVRRSAKYRDLFSSLLEKIYREVSR